VANWHTADWEVLDSPEGMDTPVSLFRYFTLTQKVAFKPHCFHNISMAEQLGDLAASIHVSPVDSADERNFNQQDPHKFSPDPAAG
jgi:hypothetical protein